MASDFASFYLDSEPETATVGSVNDFAGGYLDLEPPVKTGRGKQPENSSYPEQLSEGHLALLKEQDPEAYKKYWDKMSAIQGEQLAYGLGDVPRSIARVGAEIPGSGTLMKAAVPVYAALTGQPQVDTSKISDQDVQQAVKQDIADRNAAYEAGPGQYPGSTGNRILGQIIAAGPVLQGAGKLAGLVGEGVTSLAPRFEPAMNFLAGKVPTNAITDAAGNVIETATLGNKVAQYGASGVNAALQSVPFTATTNAASSEDIGKQGLVNAGLSAAFGAATPAVIDTGAGAVNVAKDIGSWLKNDAAPATQHAFHKLIGEVPQKLELNSPIPGVKRTFAEAAVGNENAAALQDVLSNANPDKIGPLASKAMNDQLRANNEARVAYLNKTVGSAEDTAALEAAREAQRDIDVSKLWKPGQISDVSPVKTTISDVLNHPEAGENQQVRATLQPIIDRLDKVSPSGEISPQQLYGMRKNLALAIKDLSASKESMNRQAAVNLSDVLSGFDTAINKGSPGYADYMANFAKNSKPIEAAKFLQDIAGKLTTSAGNLTLAKVDNALSRIMKLRKSAGVKGEVGAAKAITKDQLQALTNLRDDLAIAQKPNDLVNQAGGSPTVRRGIMTEKVQQVTGAKPGGKWINPTSIGTAAGAAFGGAVGSHLGPWGAAAGGDLGAILGGGIGRNVEASSLRRASELQGNLLDLMLNPGGYKNVTSSPRFYYPSSGDMRGVQQLMRSTAPVIALSQNPLLGNRGDVSGAR